MHHWLVHLCISISLFSLAASKAYADEPIELPDEELATESVLPIFDKTVAVRQRLVNTAGRLEFGAGAGLNLIEGLYNNFVFNFAGSYHLDEENAITLFAIIPNKGLSNQGEDLKGDLTLDAGAGGGFDASKAPMPELFFTGNYQFTAYYGKISVTKKKAMNLSLYGMGGIGAVKWSDKTEPLLNVGIGQKLYFNPNSAIRFDLQLMTYRGPDPTSQALPASGPSHDSGYFTTTTYFRSFLTVGLVFLL